MTEALLIIFAAGLIYYVATRVTSHGLIFKLKKDEPKPEAKLVDAEPSLGGDLIEDGQTLFNAGDLTASEKKFLAAIKNDPNAGQAYHFLGMIYLRQKMYKGAIAALEKAVQIDPLNDTDFNNLGLAYFNIDDYDKAVANLEKSVGLNDKIAHRYLNLALAYQKHGNLDKAAIALESSIKIHANTENVTLLAKNYLEMKDKKLAIKAIERLLEIEPNNSWAKRQMATLKD